MSTFMDQFAKAKEDVEELRKAFPWAFHPDGRAIVAVAAFPKLPDPSVFQRRNRDDQDKC